MSTFFLDYEAGSDAADGLSFGDSAIKSSDNSGDVYFAPNVFRPIEQAFSFTKDSQHGIPSSVSTIRGMRHPSTVLGGVTSSVVDSVNFKSRAISVIHRPSVETEKVISPVFTNDDSSCSIPLPLTGFGVEASVLHVGPHAIKPGFTQAVRSAFNQWLPALLKAAQFSRFESYAATTFSMARDKFRGLHDHILATRTSAKPITFLTLNWAKRKGSQSGELLTSNI